MGLEALAGPVGIGLSAAQTALGIVQLIKDPTKKLLAQRKAYKTPQQLFDLGNAIANRQGGFSADTLNYFNNNLNQGLASTLSTAGRLGGDPNDFASIFNNTIQSKLKLGAENQLENLKMFSMYADIQKTLADNAAAVQKSQQDLIKDQSQAAALNKQNAWANISSGVNTAISAIASGGTADLYKQLKEKGIIS